MYTPEDLVHLSLQVPPALVPEIYKWLGERMMGNEAELLEESEPSTEPARDWTLEDFKRFASGSGTVNSVMGKVFDVLAEDTEHMHGTAILERETGISRDRLRGNFSALTRHLKTHYDGLGDPFIYSWMDNTHGVTEAHYQFNEDTALLWRQAREETAE